MTVETVPAPVVFDAPLVNPAPNGLYGATSWADEGEPNRWLTAGVQVRPHNYGGEQAFGVWSGSWCGAPADPNDKKRGTRPNMDPDAFDPITAWAEDDCDLTAPSRAEVIERAQQNLRLLEQNAVETEFAARMLTDAGTAHTAANIVDAVSQLENMLARTNTIGLIHASPGWAAIAAQAMLLVRSGSSLKTPLGHTWVFGGGYVDALGTRLVATSPTFGWRGEAAVRSTEYFEWNRFFAVAERNVVVGYEKAVGAVQITP